MLLLLYVRHIRRYAHDVPWVHLGVGLFGNFAFVIGSLFAARPSQVIARAPITTMSRTIATIDQMG